MKRNLIATDTVTCPFCGSKNGIPHPQGNTIDVPFVCVSCGRSFVPRFYCPDRQASQRHIFESRALYVDNLHGLYTFCPEHTYTTYDIVTPDGRDVQMAGAVKSIQDWVAVVQTAVSALSFRAALALDGLRHRLAPNVGH